MVLGSGGMIGNGTADALGRAGHRVLRVSRSIDSGDAAGDWQKADRADAGSIRALVQRDKIEVVIDIVAYHASSTRRLLDALGDTIDHYVMISSSDVYRNYGLLHRLETGNPDPGLLDEMAPLRSSRFPYRQARRRDADDPLRWMDDYDKIPVEGIVQSIEANWTILRLPMVFGEGDRQHRFRWAVAPMLEGVARLQIPSVWSNWVSTYGYVGNVCAAIAACVGHSNAANRIFNIADGQPVPHSEWVRRFAASSDWGGVLEFVDDANHPVARATAALDLSVPLKLSGQSLVDSLGFEAPVSPSAAIAATLEDERRSLFGQGR